MYALQQQHIVVTGATGAIGSAITRTLSQAGATLSLTGRDDHKLAQLAETLPRCQVYALDLTDTDAVKNLFKQWLHESVDVLINCAGVMHDATIAMTSLNMLQQQWQINVAATYQCCQLASRLMAKQQKGNIINLASVVGEQGSAGQSAYSTTKAAIRGLTKSLAVELGPLGIRVNAIAPGFIDTPMTEHYSAAVRTALREQTSLKRLGTPEDVANAALFLASESSSYITGHMLHIDGGLRR